MVATTRCFCEDLSLFFHLVMLTFIKTSTATETDQKLTKLRGIPACWPFTFPQMFTLRQCLGRNVCILHFQFFDDCHKLHEFQWIPKSRKQQMNK
jgi:hypothetical protein